MTPGKIRPQCSLILDNGKGEILLQLRDDKPDIPFPNCWGTFGGQIEEGETPQAAMMREAKEELGIDLQTPQRLGVLEYDGYEVHIFFESAPGLEAEKLAIREGQMAKFFSRSELAGLNCAFNCREVAEFYFRKRDAKNI